MTFITVFEDLNPFIKEYCTIIPLINPKIYSNDDNVSKSQKKAPF